MICAAYTRKSSEQSDVADEEKSVTRQLDLARAYATRHGWTVDPDHVYTDDGISGSEFAKRPGLVALLNSLKPRPAFQGAGDDTLPGAGGPRPESHCGAPRSSGRWRAGESRLCQSCGRRGSRWPRCMPGRA